MGFYCITFNYVQRRSETILEQCNFFHPLFLHTLSDVHSHMSWNKYGTSSYTIHINQQNEPILNWYLNLCFLHVLNLRVHIQEDGYIYRYGIVCCMCISVGILPPTRLPTPMHVKRNILPLYIRLASWKWALGFKTCRRHHKLNY